MIGRSPRCYCSFAYSALACFRGDVGVGVPPEGEEVFVGSPTLARGEFNSSSRLAQCASDCQWV